MGIRPIDTVHPEVKIAATNREIDVPLCVVYDLENDQIKRARIYLQALLVLQQIGAIPGSEATSGT